MAIVIKKRIDLGYLGEGYADSYLTFKAIAIREYDELTSKAKAVEKDQAKALPFITAQLKERFIEGKVLGENVTADDLEDLPADVFLRCFEEIRGQLDPKD